MVWASWAVWIDNCRCASDLKVGEVFCKFVIFVFVCRGVGWGWVHVDSLSSVIGVPQVFAVS